LMESTTPVMKPKPEPDNLPETQSVLPKTYIKGVPLALCWCRERAEGAAYDPVSQQYYYVCGTHIDQPRPRGRN
jgi:hypothetical protein